MQKILYASESSQWSFSHRNPVVGSFDLHNQHADYSLLFEGIDTYSKVALDFGCGPGRNIVLFKDRFRRIDGVDLDLTNLHNAKEWGEAHGVTEGRLYHCNGVDLGGIAAEQYDVVFSTICMQHICVHEIRQNYFKEFYRLLKPGGWVSLQMGFGKDSPFTVGYYENFYEAETTNRGCDTRVEDPGQLEDDLKAVGLVGFRHWIRPPGPGDCHPNWIFFHAQKQ